MQSHDEFARLAAEYAAADADRREADRLLHQAIFAASKARAAVARLRGLLGYHVGPTDRVREADTPDGRVSVIFDLKAPGFADVAVDETALSGVAVTEGSP